MSKTNTTLTTFVIIAAVILACTVGYMIGKVGSEEVVTEPVDQGVVGGAGDSYSTQKIAAKEIDTTTTSTASFYNGDTTNRIIIGTFFHLENATSTPGAPITLYIATSSNATNFGANVNYVWEQVITTSTPTFFASTTASYEAGTTLYVWPAGTYLNFQLSSTVASGTSATYTQTAKGVTGVQYISYED